MLAASRRLLKVTDSRFNWKSEHAVAYARSQQVPITGYAGERFKETDQVNYGKRGSVREHT
jgi:hypothetical protein